jgi:SHS2 domain-containing protein
MPYHYLDHIALADAAFEAFGDTIEELFIAAGDAVMNSMVEELSSIGCGEMIAFETEHDALDLLLFNFLSELVFLKDARQLLLRVKTVSITEAGGKFKAKAIACGEKINPKKHPLLSDVKAVTLHRFTLEKTAGGWRALVILDI